MGEFYAIPIFTALACFSFSNFLFEVIDLYDQYYLREILEGFSLLFGIYLGWKYNQKIKIFITALTGADVGVYGITLAFKLQPILHENTATLVLYILTIMIFTLIGFIYQRY